MYLIYEYFCCILNYYAVQQLQRTSDIVQNTFNIQLKTYKYIHDLSLLIVKTIAFDLEYIFEYIFLFDFDFTKLFDLASFKDFLFSFRPKNYQDFLFSYYYYLFHTYTDWTSGEKTFYIQGFIKNVMHSCFKSLNVMK